VFFQDDDEDRTGPILAWLDPATQEGAAKCQPYLKQLEDRGYELRRPLSDFQRGTIYELRPSYQGVHYRIL
jgi:hypothetical protein